jgi:subtilisin family serine protease
MRNTMIAAATAAALIAVPGAALAQGTTTGVARDSAVVGIAAEQRSAFRDYIDQEQVPDYKISESVKVGTVLPEIGVSIYDVPQRFGQTTSRYTVVNGETVLVEPSTRRIIQVID